jgi:hypothetical protein
MTVLLITAGGMAVFTLLMLFADAQADRRRGDSPTGVRVPAGKR